MSTIEPDPRQKDEWLLWRYRHGGDSSLAAYSVWNASMAWNARIQAWHAEHYPAPEPEPDPNDRLAWLAWRMAGGAVSSLRADADHKARLAEWREVWLKETGGHLE